MSEMRIENDLAKLLEKIDRPTATREEDAKEILASAVFLAVFVPDESLKPRALFDRLVMECGWPLDYRWAQNWALGQQGVFHETAVKTLPIIRDHVIRMEEAWRRAAEKQLAELQAALKCDPNYGDDDFNDDLIDDFKKDG